MFKPVQEMPLAIRAVTEFGSQLSPFLFSWICSNDLQVVLG